MDDKGNAQGGMGGMGGFGGGSGFGGFQGFEVPFPSAAPLTEGGGGEGLEGGGRARVFDSVILAGFNLKRILILIKVSRDMSGLFTQQTFRHRDNRSM